MDYVKGDKVRILGVQFPGSMPTVGTFGNYVRKHDDDLGQERNRPHEVRAEEDGIRWFFADEEIEPTEVPPFQTGDIVRIASTAVVKTTTLSGDIWAEHTMDAGTKLTKFYSGELLELVERAPRARFEPGDKVKVDGSNMLRVVISDDGKKVKYINIDAVNATSSAVVHVFTAGAQHCEPVE